MFRFFMMSIVCIVFYSGLILMKFDISVYFGHISGMDYFLSNLICGRILIISRDIDDFYQIWYMSIFWSYLGIWTILYQIWYMCIVDHFSGYRRFWSNLIYAHILIITSDMDDFFEFCSSIDAISPKMTVLDISVNKNKNQPWRCFKKRNLVKCKD